MISETQMDELPDPQPELTGRVFRRSEHLSKSILAFLRKSGLIIPVADDCWIFSASAEGQLAAMLSHELHPSSEAIQGLADEIGGDPTQQNDAT